MSFKFKNNKDNIITVDSNDIKKLLSKIEELKSVKDISKLANTENIFAFDCKLNELVFTTIDVDEVMEELDEDMEDSIITVLFEDIKAFVKDLTDEFESEIQEKYFYDDVRCNFDFYSVDENNMDFKFVILVSFGDVKFNYLTSLTNLISKKQLTGGSKYYS